MPGAFDDLIPGNQSPSQSQAAGAFDDLLPARKRVVTPAPVVPVVPVLPAEPTVQELEMASRPAVMTRSRAGAPIMQPNTPAPAPETPSANWFGPGGVTESLLPGAALSASETVGRLRQLAGTSGVEDRQLTIDQAGQDNPMGWRVPQSAIQRQMQLLAADKQAAAQGEIIASGAKAEREAITPKNMSTFQKAASSISQSAAPTLLGLAATIATRSPALGAAIAGGGGGAQAAAGTYGEALEKGAPHRLAARAAGIDALLESVGEALPFGVMFKKGTALYKRMFNTIAAEAGQEGATQVMQDLHAMGTYNPKLTAKEMWENFKVATAAGAFGGSVYGGIGHAAQSANEKGQKDGIAKIVSDMIDAGSNAKPAQSIDEIVRRAMSVPQSRAPAEQQPVDAMPYNIIDHKTGAPVKGRGPYQTLSRANRAVDQLDNEYGGYRYHANKLPDEQAPDEENEPLHVDAQQQMGGSKVRETVQQQLQQADENLPDFDHYTREIAESIGGYAIVAPVKGIDRATEKVETDYAGDASRLTDALRSTIVVNFPEDIADKAQSFIRSVPLAKPPKNLYAKPGEGYAHLMAVVARPYGPAEMQFNVPEMIAAKDRAHVLYQKQSDIERAAGGKGFTKEQAREWAELTARQQSIYTNARTENAARKKRGEVWTPKQIEQYLENNKTKAKELGAQDLERFKLSATKRLKSASDISTSPDANLGPRNGLPLGTSNANILPPSIASTRTGIPSQSQNEVMSGSIAPDENADSQQQQIANGREDADTRGRTEAGGLQDGGRIPGRTGRIQEPGKQAAGNALKGLPAEVEIPGRGIVTFGPFKVAHDAASAYAQSSGIPYQPQTTYVKVDRARAVKIANEFETMKHAPNDPEVKRAYAAMIKEVIAQWQAVKKTGLKVELIKPGMTDPYAATPRMSVLDVTENNHLWVYPTDFGFGAGSDDFADFRKGNPMLQLTDEVIDGRRVRANDIFRIVHDYFGHIKDGVGFRADGEENAWRSHSAMFSPLARRAMTTETRGQNSWLNFGPHGDKNRTAKTEDTVFAEQKIGLMPEWVSEDGATDAKEVTAIDRAKQAPKWWDEPSENPYAKGMTNGQVQQEWLERHKVEKDGENYIFYHATPKQNVANIEAEGLRAGSYLATSAAHAIGQVKQFHEGAKTSEVEVIRVALKPWEFWPGVHPSLRESKKVSVTKDITALDTVNAFSRLGLKTGNPEQFGFNSRIERNSITALTPEQQEKLSAALDLVIAGGIPEHLIKSIKAWVSFSPQMMGYSAAYWPQGKVIGVRSDLLAKQSPKQLAQSIAHELGHALDDSGGNFTLADLRAGKEYISANSPRTQFTMSIDDGIAMFDNPGDLIDEIINNNELGDYFAYPGVALMEQRMKPGTGSTEFFSQVNALYTLDPELVRRSLPKWFKVMRSIYGETKQDAPRTLAETRSRLRQALQNDSPIVKTDGAVTRGNHQPAVRINTQPGAPRGPPAPGVGKGNSSNPPTPPGQPPNTGASGPGNAPVNGSWSINEPGLIDNIVRELQNNKIDLHRVQTAIEQVAGTTPVNDSPTLAEELFKGRVRTKIVRAQKRLIEPMLKAMAAAKITPEQMGKYLWARHVPERNRQMAKVNDITNTPANNLAGMTDGEAARIISDIRKAGNLGDYSNIANMVYAITDATQQIFLNENLESQQTINAWNNTYQHYVPLFRDIEEPMAGAGFEVKGPESKRAMGSQREAIAVLAAVIAQHEKAIVRAEKADIGRKLIKLAEANPHPDFWRVDQPPTKRIINKTTGLVESIIDPLYKQREDIFIVKDRVGGQIVERVLAFNPKSERALSLSKALQNLDVVQLGAVTKAVGSVTRIMAQLATSWNPQFWVTNFARDVQTASVNLQATPLKGQAPQVLANIPKAMAGIMSAEFRNGTGRWAQLYRQFEDEGGKMGFLTMFDDLIDRQKQIGKEIARSQRGNLNPLKWANISVETIEKVNAAVENATRLAAFEAALKHGMAPKAAASLAKNLTVNFDRKGNRSSAIGAWYMFFNASLQGTAILFKAIASSRRVQGYVGVMVAFAAAMELINRLIGDADRDEDGNNPYELIPSYIRQNNMVFMLPKSERTDQNKGVVTIPLPYGFSIFHNIGRMMMETALGNSTLVDEKVKPFDRAMQVADAIANNFVPFGGTSTPLQYFAPTIVKPIVQQVENKTWYGAPIHPEPQQFGKAKAKSEQYFRSTSDTAKEISRVLSQSTGGDEIKGGDIDIYPGNLDHIFGTITGGTGRFGLGMFDFSKHLIGRASGESKPDDMPWRNVPFVGKFYGEVDERDRAAKYYRLSKEAQQAWQQYSTYKKAGERDKADAIEDKHPELIDMAKVIVSKRHRADMKSLREEFTEVNELPRGERARARAELRKDEATIMGAALRAYNKAIEEKRSEGK